MVFLLLEVSTLVATLGKMYCKGYMYGDITNACETMHKVK